MKGFYIRVKNDLIETKHWENMGIAVWLYLWLIDKITSISEQGVGLVLGGKPITHEDLVADGLELPSSTYHRYVATLRNAGYISTKRTTNGLIIKVLKSKKRITRIDKSQPEITKQKSDLSKMGPDLSKVINLKAENDKSIYNVLDSAVDSAMTLHKEIDKEKNIFQIKNPDVLTHALRNLQKDFPTKEVKKEYEKAKDYILSTGKTYKDYAAFFRNWLRRAPDTILPEQKTGYYEPPVNPNGIEQLSQMRKKLTDKWRPT